MTALSYSWTTLRRMQREKGRVTITMSQDITKRIHPHIPIPASLIFASSCMMEASSFPLVPFFIFLLNLKSPSVERMGAAQRQSFQYPPPSVIIIIIIYSSSFTLDHLHLYHPDCHQVSLIISPIQQELAILKNNSRHHEVVFYLLFIDFKSGHSLNSFSDKHC